MPARAIRARFPMLVDSHCHLDFPDFACDLDAVLARAHAADIGRLLTVCTRVRSHHQVLDIAERFEPVYCSVGTHPHHAKDELDISVQELVRPTNHPKVVAIGESGLDFHYDFSSRADQEQVLRTHIRAARETGLPLIVHAREADDAVADLLTSEHAAGPFAAVLHCFTGSRALAMAGVALGFYVSFSGIVTFKRSDELRAIASEIPEDRILIETDAPYLAPQPWRGKRNEPSFVAENARVLAHCRGQAVEHIHQITTENFYRLFTKVPRPAKLA